MAHTKKLLIVIFAAVLALCLASQALADPTPSPTPTPATQAFTCLGKVTAIDQTAGTISVTVKRASLALQGSLGQSLTLNVTATSALSRFSAHTKCATTLADVAVGNLLVASGATDVTTTPGTTLYDITKACVWQPRAQTRFLCLGAVTSVDLQGNDLVVCVARGSLGLRGFVRKDVTIELPTTAKIFVLQGGQATATTIDQITVGDRVVIRGTADRSDPSLPVFTARRVLVHHVVALGRLKWFAACGQVSALDTNADTLTLTVARGTRALRSDIGSGLTLDVMPASVIRTLSGGVVTTVPLASVTVGESIVVTGAIDHSNPTAPVYDLGHAFVWQLDAGLVRSAA
jgi:hypothetical protein